jgi:hypothetical protein
MQFELSQMESPCEHGFFQLIPTIAQMPDEGTPRLRRLLIIAPHFV